MQSFSENSICRFVSRIFGTDWHNVLSKNDTNTVFDTLHDMFRDIHNAYFPMIRVKGEGKGKQS